MEEGRLAKQVELLWKIRDFYLPYETEESKRRKTALSEIEEELNSLGVESLLLVTGSLAAGMSVKTEKEKSDVDLMYVGDVEKFNALYGGHETGAIYFNGRHCIHVKLEQKLGYPVF